MSWFRKRQLTDRERALLAAIDESERLQAYRQGYMDGMTVQAARMVNGEPVTILGYPVEVAADWNPDGDTRTYFDWQARCAADRYAESLANPYEKLNARR